MATAQSRPGVPSRRSTKLQLEVGTRPIRGRLTPDDPRDVQHAPAFGFRTDPIQFFQGQTLGLCRRASTQSQYPRSRAPDLLEPDTEIGKLLFRLLLGRRLQLARARQVWFVSLGHRDPWARNRNRSHLGRRGSDRFEQLEKGARRIGDDTTEFSNSFAASGRTCRKVVPDNRGYPDRFAKWSWLDHELNRVALIEIDASDNGEPALRESDDSTSHTPALRNQNLTFQPTIDSTLSLRSSQFPASQLPAP